MSVCCSFDVFPRKYDLAAMSNTAAWPRLCWGVLVITSWPAQELGGKCARCKLPIDPMG